MDISALLLKYNDRVPRYTSYPTAPYFNPSVDGGVYASWLRSLPADTPVSLYLHVPFCEQLCLYCGCHTTVVRKAGPRRSYAGLLAREIALVAKLIGRRLPVQEIHWGGGTPTTIPADCLCEITGLLHEVFKIAPSTATSVEIDPRHLPEDRLQALGAMGVTRASLGVQDLDPTVQRAVGRVQPFDMVRDCIGRLRDIGVGSVNLDLIYGLPHQTEAGAEQTAAQVATLRAERIAAFGYAHVPWMKRHQKLIPELALPGPEARYAQRAMIEKVLRQAGYVSIGLDHFALPGDALAKAARHRTLRRNFQGYTTDTAPTLLGFGSSAIGHLPQGYAQNAASTVDYAAAITDGRPATARGVALSDDDRLRREVIEMIMCHAEVDLLEVARRHDADPAGLLGDAKALQAFSADGLVRMRSGQIRVMEAGRPFLRMVAAAFDTYRTDNALLHACAI